MTLYNEVENRGIAKGFLIAVFSIVLFYFSFKITVSAMIIMSKGHPFLSILFFALFWAWILKYKYDQIMNFIFNLAEKIVKGGRIVWK